MGISGEKLALNPLRLAKRKPITADIYLTERCNNKCFYCDYDAKTRRNGKEMNAQEFARYANLLIAFGVRGIILTGGGEPSLCKDFGEICEWLKANNVAFGVNTNFCRYFMCDATFIKVSLDGWDKESYARIRGVDAYDSVIENVKRATREKRGWQKIGVQQVATSVDDVERFYNAHRELAVDYFNFRPIESVDAEYYRKNGANYEEAYKIRAYLRKLTERDGRVVVNYKWEHIRDTSTGECAANWSYVCVDAFGNVLLCCNRPRDVLGHITDDDIQSKIAAGKTGLVGCNVPCRLTGANCYYERWREQSRQPDRFFI